jgi:ribonucleoside-diphosphate reductase alpha chain
LSDPTNEALEQYTKACVEFERAKQELEDALHKMNGTGHHPAPPTQIRYRLLDERPGRTCKFQIGFGEEGLEGYFTCNEYSDGKPGELFIVAGKGGEVVSGLLDIIAPLISIALQSGVSLQTLIQKFRHTRFGPSGMVMVPQNGPIKTASSVMDFIMHWMELKYTDKTGEQDAGHPA